MSTLGSVGASSSAWTGMASAMSSMRNKLFAKIDADSSGSIDTSELTKAFGAVDSSSDDASSDATSLMKSLDTNGDGSLSSDELTTGMQQSMPPPSTQDFMRSHNAGSSDSSDGSASTVSSATSASSASGASSAADELFSALDANGDGSVTSDELSSFMSQITSDASSTTSSTGTSGTDATSSSDDTLAALFAKLDAGSTDGPPQGAQSGPPPAGGAHGSHHHHGGGGSSSDSSSSSSSSTDSTTDSTTASTDDPDAISTMIAKLVAQYAHQGIADSATVTSSLVSTTA